MDERADATANGSTEIEPPRLLLDVGKGLVTVAAGALGGPAAAVLAEKGMGWLDLALGGAGLATSTAAGYAAIQRRQKITAERHRKQLIASVESARDQLPEDVDAAFIGALAQRQDNDLQTLIKKETG